VLTENRDRAVQFPVRVAYLSSIAVAPPQEFQKLVAVDVQGQSLAMTDMSGALYDLSNGSMNITSNASFTGSSDPPACTGPNPQVVVSAAADFTGQMGQCHSDSGNIPTTVSASASIPSIGCDMSFGAGSNACTTASTAKAQVCLR